MTPDKLSRIINPKKGRAHLLVSRFARNVRANLILSMAIYHLTVKTGSRYGGQSALAKSEYIEREGKYAHQDDELAHRESDNMPEWPRKIRARTGKRRTRMSGPTVGFSAKWNLPCPWSERGRAD